MKLHPHTWRSYTKISKLGATYIPNLRGAYNPLLNRLRAREGETMKLWFITMNFPNLSETFAVNDVRALQEAQVDISVHSLRSAHPAAAKLSEQLVGVPITHSSVKARLGGLREMLRRPGRALRFLIWVIRHSSKHGHWRLEPLAKGLALVPRALQLFRQMELEQPDVVHLFWGHYPAIFAHLVQAHYPGIVSSVFLGPTTSRRPTAAASRLHNMLTLCGHTLRLTSRTSSA